MFDTAPPQHPLRFSGPLGLRSEASKHSLSPNPLVDQKAQSPVENPIP